MAWPTTSNPRTEFVTLRLTADEAASLDAYAASRGLSRSAALRAGHEALTDKAVKKAARSKTATP